MIPTEPHKWFVVSYLLFLFFAWSTNLSFPVLGKMCSSGFLVCSRFSRTSSNHFRKALVHTVVYTMHTFSFCQPSCARVFHPYTEFITHRSPKTPRRCCLGLWTAVAEKLSLQIYLIKWTDAHFDHMGVYFYRKTPNQCFMLFFPFLKMVFGGSPYFSTHSYGHQVYGHPDVQFLWENHQIAFQLCLADPSLSTEKFFHLCLNCFRDSLNRKSVTVSSLHRPFCSLV